MSLSSFAAKDMDGDAVEVPRSVVSLVDDTMLANMAGEGSPVSMPKRALPYADSSGYLAVPAAGLSHEISFAEQLKLLSDVALRQQQLQQQQQLEQQPVPSLTVTTNDNQRSVTSPSLSGSSDRESGLQPPSRPVPPRPAIDTTTTATRIASSPDSGLSSPTGSGSGLRGRTAVTHALGLTSAAVAQAEVTATSMLRQSTLSQPAR